MISLLFILMAWFVEMPLWLSILTTVLAGLRFSIKLGVEIGKVAKG